MNYRNILLAILTAIFSMVPILGAAQGKHTPGTVLILENVGSDPYIFGMYNVRYNPNVAHGKIFLSVSPGSFFMLQGVDSGGGTTPQFACSYTASQDPVKYAKWEAALTAAGNGAAILATHAPNSAQCKTLRIYTGSNMQD